MTKKQLTPHDMQALAWKARKKKFKENPELRQKMIDHLTKISRERWKKRKESLSTDSKKEEK